MTRYPGLPRGYSGCLGSSGELTESRANSAYVETARLTNRLWEKQLCGTINAELDSAELGTRLAGAYEHLDRIRPN
jgi:hypothetical protein